MYKGDEHAAWKDAFQTTKRLPEQDPSEAGGWYGTACAIAAGLLALWALY